MEWLINIYRDNQFLLQTWIGCLCGHALSLYDSQFKGTIPFLKKIIPNKKDTLYFRIDFLFLPLIGAVLGFNLLDPTSLKAAIFSGLSWSAALTVLLKKVET